jgi:uncharacterized protein
MKKYLLFALLLIIVFPVKNFSQEKKEGESPKFELVQYYFVLLMKGPDRTQPDSVAQKLQDGHMANINKMAKDGKLLCAGPFADEKGGGIFVLNIKTVEEGKKLLDGDPAVKAGRLIYEIRPWMTVKGTFTAEK